MPDDDAPALVPPPTARPAASLEQRLASRWMVWLGGGTLALAVVLFLNYAIEHAWLSPLIRVLLGGLFGAALIAAGNLAQASAIRELSRRVADPGDAALDRVENFVPAALTGAGLFALYASVEVAYAFYGLLGGPVAFALLAAVGFFGMSLALRHGWLVAALGMIGAYLAPALIASDQPSVVALFVYLAAVSVVALWLASARHWPQLAVAGWVGAFGWAFVWMQASWTPGDEAVLGPYVLLIGLVSTLVPAKLRAAPGGAVVAGPRSPSRGCAGRRIGGHDPERRHDPRAPEHLADAVRRRRDRRLRGPCRPAPEPQPRRRAPGRRRRRPGRPGHPRPGRCCRST